MMQRFLAKNKTNFVSLCFTFTYCMTRSQLEQTMHWLHCCKQKPASSNSVDLSGQLSLALTDSQGQPIQAEFQPVADNVTRVAYTPKAAGPMTAHVTFNNQPVPKSPFQVEVLPELDVSKVFVENLEPSKCAVLGGAGNSLLLHYA